METEYDAASATTSDGKPERNKVEKCFPQLQMKALKKKETGSFIFVVYTTCI